MKKTLSTILAICILGQALFVPTTALAQQLPGMPAMSLSSAREYFVGRDLGQPIVTVHLLNGVTNPGVYHVPAGTDIAVLIAYAGGATERSDLSGVIIRRKQGATYSLTEIDLEKALSQPTDLFRVQDQDVLRIEQQISVEKPLQWISIASSIASVVLSVYLIRNMK